jgi:hypothetical protein
MEFTKEQKNYLADVYANGKSKEHKDLKLLKIPS